MTKEQLKQKLYSDKVRDILASDHIYLYQETCEFISEKYLLLAESIAEKESLDLILPLITMDEFKAQTVKRERGRLIEKLKEKLPLSGKKNNEVQLSYAVEKEDDKLLSLIAFRHSQRPLADITMSIGKLTIEEKEDLFHEYFMEQPPLKELELFTYTFELCVDFLTMKKLEKVDVNAMIVQDISVNNGYFTPDAILNSEHHGDYIAAMKRAVKAYEQLSPLFPVQSQYLVPRAFLQKILLNLNLNQLQKLNCEVAEDLWDKVRKVHPTLYLGLKKKFL